MFDWISDAIDWIGDGISSLWDSTIGGAVDAISDAVWDIMFEWLFNKVYGAVAELFMFIDQSATDLFSLAWVRTFVSLFQALGWMLFVCGLVMAVFDTAMAYESGAANIRQTCVNVIKGFMAAALFAVVPQRLYELCIALQGSFSYDLLGVFLSDTYSTIADSGLSVLYVLASDVSLFSLFFIILFGYCTVKVVFANIKRGGIMLCQIAVGSIYMIGIPRGFTDGFSSFKVAEIFGTVGERNFGFVKKIAQLSPETKIYSNLSPTMLFYEPDERVNVYIGKDCAYYHPDIAGADFNDEIQPFGYAGVKKLFCDLEKALDRKGAEDK